MTIITGAHAELPVYNSAIKKNFSKINGRPSRRDRNTLHKEVEHVLIEVSVQCFEYSGKYGLLTEARTATAYSNLNHLNYTRPSSVEHKMADPDNTDVTSAFEKEKQKAEWNRMHTLWYTRRGALYAICKNIQDALGKIYYK